MTIKNALYPFPNKSRACFPKSAKVGGDIPNDERFTNNTQRTTEMRMIGDWKNWIIHENLNNAFDRETTQKACETTTK